MRISKRYVVLLALVCLTVGVVALAVSAAAKQEKDKEETVPMEKAPQAVRAAIEKEAPDAKSMELKREVDDGFAAYEAEFLRNDVKQSLTIAEDGAILEKEQQVAVPALPPAVAAQVQKHFPKATIKKAEQVVSTYYEVTLDVAGKEREIKVCANGQPVEDED